jgi:hypothetical protein
MGFANHDLGMLLLPLPLPLAPQHLQVCNVLACQASNKFCQPRPCNMLLLLLPLAPQHLQGGC